MTDTFGPFFAGRSRGVGGFETICIARGNPQDFDNLADAQIAWTAYDHGNAKEADLLCAAPDMLAALEAVCKFIDNGTPVRPGALIVDDIKAAIARARGE
jgi:hypothetical protein